MRREQRRASEGSVGRRDYTHDSVYLGEADIDLFILFFFF